MEGKNIIFIDDDLGCKATAMIPQELLKHLKNEGIPLIQPFPSIFKH
jgi:hypothetical protein